MKKTSEELVIKIIVNEKDADNIDRALDFFPNSSVSMMLESEKDLDFAIFIETQKLRFQKFAKFFGSIIF